MPTTSLILTRFSKKATKNSLQFLTGLDRHFSADVTMKSKSEVCLSLLQSQHTALSGQSPGHQPLPPSARRALGRRVGHPARAARAHRSALLPAAQPGL